MTDPIPVTVADAMRLIERYGNARRGVSPDLRVIRPEIVERTDP